MTTSQYKNLQKSHINEVRFLIKLFRDELYLRSETHDSSKLEDPELSIMSKNIDALQESVYGTDEWKSLMNKIKPIKDHHYKLNRHHPEHFNSDLTKMNLIDIVEMVCDWISANRIHGNELTIYQSLDICFKRFNINSPLKEIIINTVERLKGIDNAKGN